MVLRVIIGFLVKEICQESNEDEVDEDDSPDEDPSAASH